MPPTVYLVSGANRGIGKSNPTQSARLSLTSALPGLGIVKALATRPETIVFAGARTPSSANALGELAKTQKNVHVLKLTSCDEADNHAAVAEIKRIAGALHVVIANAGKYAHLSQSNDG
jgi:NAD(P)-dependent dehydrogenase (short-subunit alcohol dehydrogenase family)